MTTSISSASSILIRLSSRFRTLLSHQHCLFSTATVSPISDANLVDKTCAPCDFNDSAVVYANVVSEDEAKLLAEHLSSQLKRRRYQQGHWDSVIIKYKEVEMNDVSQDILVILDRIRSVIRTNHLPNSEPTHWLPPHVIDLHANGELNAHIDSIRFSGLTVSGLSLLSPSIMRLKPSLDALLEWKEGPMEGQVDLLLPPRSLYCLSGPSRFRYSHELLPSEALFRGEKIIRDLRLSIIFRDMKAD